MLICNPVRIISMLSLLCCFKQAGHGQMRQGTLNIESWRSDDAKHLASDVTYSRLSNKKPPWHNSSISRDTTQTHTLLLYKAKLQAGTVAPYYMPPLDTSLTLYKRVIFGPRLNRPKAWSNSLTPR